MPAKIEVAENNVIKMQNEDRLSIPKIGVAGVNITSGRCVLKVEVFNNFSAPKSYDHIVVACDGHLIYSEGLVLDQSTLMKGDSRMVISENGEVSLVRGTSHGFERISADTHRLIEDFQVEKNPRRSNLLLIAGITFRAIEGEWR